jgi:uncharacterized protein YdbL (DUF1318 family)
MKIALKYFLAVIACSFLFSCFNITVNVYFPEKDVKSAFKTLEQELMKGEPAPESPAAPAPETAPPAGPHTWLRFEFGPKEVYAQGAGELSSELADKLKNEPSVVQAYRAMGERLGFVNRLRDQGLVGEGKDGLLAARGTLDKRSAAAMAEENSDRQTIIKAMAKAIVQINNQPVNDQTISQVLDKAAAQFASVRRDSAKAGWWVQGEDGAWAKK